MANEHMFLHTSYLMKVAVEKRRRKVAFKNAEK